MTVLNSSAARVRGVVATVVLLGIAALSVGCSSTPRFAAHEATVRLDPAWKQSGNVPSLMVDLVVTQRSDEVAGISVSDYFAPGQSAGLRSDLKSLGQVKSFTFSSNDTSDKVVAKGDPVWKEWQKAGGDLFVLVNLLTPSDDSRRARFSLIKGTWKGEKLDIMIQRSGIANRSERIVPSGG